MFVLLFCFFVVFFVFVAFLCCFGLYLFMFSISLLELDVGLCFGLTLSALQNARSKIKNIIGGDKPTDFIVEIADDETEEETNNSVSHQL
jgi:hypothetical protein